MLVPKPFPLLLLLPLAACHHPKPPENPAAPVTVEGKGKLLSLDQTLGMGTLDFNGSNVMFWWNNQLRRPGSEGDPEIKVSNIPFQANIGDTIYFRGIQARGGIFITAAATQK